MAARVTAEVTDDYHDHIVAMAKLDGSTVREFILDALRLYALALTASGNGGRIALVTGKGRDTRLKEIIIRRRFDVLDRGTIAHLTRDGA